jgi:hypothetical protein
MKKLNRNCSRGDHHVRLHHWMLRCEAWRTLSPNAKAILIDIWQRHNGVNNGSISFSVREAGEIGITRSAAARAMKELIERGFIAVTRASAFTLKTKEARLWCLTAEPTDPRDEGFHDLAPRGSQSLQRGTVSVTEKK